jgi:TolB-like protein
MKKQNLAFCSFVLFAFFYPGALPAKSVSAADSPTIAVLDFENNSLFNREEYQSLSKGLAEMMITGLNQAGSLRVVERQKLRSILDELKLSQSGAVSEESSIRAGKLLGARHLVFGSFLTATDTKIRIDVRIVEVETGLTVKANEVTGKTKDILSLIAKLNDKILKDLNIRLAENRKKSEMSGEINPKAVMLFSQGVGYEDAGDTSQAAECYRKALKIEPDFQQARIRLQALNGKSTQ